MYKLKILIKQLSLGLTFKIRNMSFSDLYDSGFRTRNQDHFASIVRVAMDDGVISDAEKSFLDRLARNLSISMEEYDLILEDYLSSQRLHNDF